MKLDLRELENVLKLMDKYKVETVSFEGFTVTKTIHAPKQTRRPAKQKDAPQPKPSNWTEEDVLYYSSQAPKIDPNKLYRYGSNVPQEMIPDEDKN